jgi:hypothetical protein
MGEGLGTDTPPPSQAAAADAAVPQRTANGSAALRTMVIVALAIATAGVAFFVFRAATRRPPADPTTERIQSLIDEANRLLKQLDEEKRG